MSGLLQNKQILHVFAEITILLVILFYFSQKTRKLQSYIQDIHHRLEEQDEIIRRHDELLKKIVSRLERGSLPPPSLKKKVTFETPYTDDSDECKGGVCPIGKFKKNQPPPQEPPTQHSLEEELMMNMGPMMNTVLASMMFGQGPSGSSSEAKVEELPSDSEVKEMDEEIQKELKEMGDNSID